MGGPTAQQRINALASHNDTLSDEVRMWCACAEKAEAELERMKRLHMHGPHCGCGEDTP